MGKGGETIRRRILFVSVIVITMVIAVAAIAALSSGKDSGCRVVQSCNCYFESNAHSIDSIYITEFEGDNDILAFTQEDEIGYFGGYWIDDALVQVIDAARKDTLEVSVDMAVCHVEVVQLTFRARPRD